MGTVSVTIFCKADELKTRVADTSRRLRVAVHDDENFISGEP
jgi:hypothetical protein